MIRFEHPAYFIALVVVILCGVLWHSYIRADRRWSEMFKRAASTKYLRRKFIWWGLAMAFMVMALVNPQYGYKETKVQRRSSDIYIALDISKSMDAEDIQPSRIDRAKKIGESLIKSMRTERIGLILFAAEAYMQMPLTHDYRTALLFLKNASTQQAGVQGTTISDVMDLAIRLKGEESLRSRILIIISDGESHDDYVVSKAEEAFDDGLIIFTVGMGTKDGAYIPLEMNGKRDYVRSESGELVRSTLVDQTLIQLASAGGGDYFYHADARDLYRAVKEKVARVERRAYDSVVFTARASYYRWFVWPALLCALYASRPFWKQEKMK